MTVSRKDRWYKKGTYWGIILAIISVGLGIYDDYIRKHSPDLDYDIISNTSVIDVNENLSDLSIIYKGDSIGAENSVQVLIIRVINRGDEPILQDYYANVLPIGFQIIGGKIIEKPSIIKASNDYLKMSTSVNFDSLNTVTFNKNILDPQDFFIVKVLMLRGKEEPLQVKPIGKVAKVSSINVNEEFSLEVDNDWFGLTFASIIAVAMVLMGWIVEQNIDWRIKKSREGKIQKFKNYYEGTLNHSDAVFFELYKNNGWDALSYLSLQFTGSTNLNSNLIANNRLDIKNEDIEKSTAMIPEKYFKPVVFALRDLMKMESLGIIEVGDEVYFELDSSRADVLESLLNFTRINAREGSFQSSAMKIMEFFNG